MPAKGTPMRKPRTRDKRIPTHLTEMSLTEVAEKMGMSPQRVQQIEIRALQKVRRAARWLQLQGYLE